MNAQPSLADSRYLQHLKVPQIREHIANATPVILPVGSIEQHGAYLPTGCDTLTAIGVAEAAAGPAEAIIAPPIWYGWAPHHMAHPGTVTVRPETLTALVTDVGTSLAKHGFTCMVVVNGHRYSNVPPLALAAEAIQEASGMVTVIADLSYMAGDVYTEWIADEESGGFGHGDAYETAHVMHLHPELVEPDAMPEIGPASWGSDFEGFDPWHPARRAAFWPGSEEKVRAKPTGGNPRWATPERGERLHDALTRDVIDLVTLARRRASER